MSVLLFSCWGSENIRRLQVEINEHIREQNLMVISQTTTSSVSQTGSVFFAISLVVE